MTVSIIMGSISDVEVAKKAIEVLKEFQIDYKVKVLSAHRTPDLLAEYVKEMEDKIDVTIAIAGKAAHLGGVISAYSIHPVIGVPVKSSHLGGLEALLSTVEMPSGVTVATVAINGGYNAGLLAVEMLSTGNSSQALNLQEKLKKHKEQLKDKVVAGNKELEEMNL